MVFGGEITFSTPPKLFRLPIIFFGGVFFFFFFSKKPIVDFFGGRLRSNIFRRPSEKTIFLFSFFSAPPRYGVRQPNDFFDPPKIFCGGPFFFGRSEKPPFFGAKNQKPAFSAGVEGAKA